MLGAEGEGGLKGGLARRSIATAGTSDIMYSNYYEEKMPPVRDARLCHPTLEPSLTILSEEHRNKYSESWQSHTKQ